MFFRIKNKIKRYKEGREERRGGQKQQQQQQQ